MANERFKWNPTPRATGLLWALGVSIVLWVVIIWAAGALAPLSGLPAIRISEPPPRFDYEPRQPYTVTVIADHMDLVRRCRMGFHAHLIGCARPRRNEIYIISGLSDEDFATVLRHEKAHLNGWRH